jgi:hypothetical protein
MKKHFYIILSIVLISSCGVLMKPIVEPIADSFVDCGQEMEIDSCEQTLISIIIVKRFMEQKFPVSLDQLDYMDIKNSIDTTQYTDSEKKEYKESIETETNEWLLPWINNCKRNFDTVSMHPYSVDSLKLDWTKISDLENSSKKIVKESWMLKVKSDSIIEPYFIDLEIEVVDSSGRVISKMTGIEKRDK